MSIQKRFRKEIDGKAAEVWIEVGVVRYKAELYENGEFVERQRGRYSKTEETRIFLSGQEFSALLHLDPDRTIRCTGSR